MLSLIFKEGILIYRLLYSIIQTIKLNFAVIIKVESGDVLRVKNNSGAVTELLQPNIDIIKIK